MNTLPNYKKLLQLKKYSINTQRSYVSLLGAFFTTYNWERPENINENVLLQIAGEYILYKKYKYNSQKQFLGALNLFYNVLHARKINFNSLYPSQKPEHIPQILSFYEVKKLLRNMANLKHKTMLSTVYALGLRSGELLNLQVGDIDGKRMLVHIKAAKGNKDRILPLSAKLLTLLRAYFKEYKPNSFLFEGQKGSRYSATSLRNVFKKACRLAGIKKKVTLHSLRHSYATHLLEKGTDVRIIQKLLGHKSINTTMLYTKVTDVSLARVESPFEDL